MSNFVEFFLVQLVLLFGSVVFGLAPSAAIEPTYYCVDSAQYPTVYRCADNRRPLTFTDDLAAFAKFSERSLETGWAELEVVTNENLPDELQAYQAGFLEGYITCQMNLMSRQNLLQQPREQINTGAHCDKYSIFMYNITRWIYQQTELYPKDTYWKQVNMTLFQMSGVEHGYLSGNNIFDYNGPNRWLYPCGIMLQNLFSEFTSINRLIGWTIPDDHDWPTQLSTALVKVLPNASDVLLGHNTWAHYGALTRIMKRYTLNLRTSKAKTVVMSSYPGMIFSADEFYITDQKLAIQKTSYDYFNDDLALAGNQTEMLYQFIRSTVASRLAQNGPEWAQLYEKHNGGTQNGQYMVADYKHFKPGQIDNGFLTILEQLPDKIVYKDMTKTLIEQTYWPSYNVPYFEEIYNLSHFNVQFEKYGDYYSYGDNARAKILKRDHSKVTNLTAMYHLMRYNDYRHDPFSHCNCTPGGYSAEFAMAARADLNDPKGHYPDYQIGSQLMGTIDSKVTTSKMVNDLEMVAISGPVTNEPNNIPSFNWTTTHFKSYVHKQQPIGFDFNPVMVSWKNDTASFDEWIFKGRRKRRRNIYTNRWQHTTACHVTI